jgi:ABC-type polysaccharide/polyol phosphate export permease
VLLSTHVCFLSRHNWCLDVFTLCSPAVSRRFAASQGHDALHAPLDMAYVVYGIIVGGITCTCFSILVALWVKSHDRYTVVTTCLIYFMIPTLSPTFFPLIPELPDAMETAFWLNPMTYTLNVIRDGMFNQIDPVTTNTGVIILAGSAGIAVYAAMRLMLRDLMRDSL